MSKIKDAILQAEEEYGEDFYQAYDEWDMEKLNTIVFRSTTVNGKKVLTNIK